MIRHDLTLNGQTIHLRDTGDPDAPALLMLHGFPEYGGAWGGLAALLSDRYRCLFPDQRGYGRSSAPAEVEAYRIKPLVEDMAALITWLGRPVTVIGHDWGAAVAYALAIARPDLVGRLVILNGVHPGPFQAALATGGAQAAASQYMHALRAEGAEAHFSADGHRRLLRLFAENMDMSWMTSDLRETYVAEWSRPGRLTGMLNWYRASPVVVPKPGEPVAIPPLPADRFRVTMPHLLIWGRGDTALLPEATEGLESYCADLTRVEVPGADHWIVHQRTEEVAHIIGSWLAGQTAG
ncbi:alpha/beta hydrolase [Primorskyibacter flagellatus]|uniref:Alpha/beta hydrolase n=1 Tax=Primorskyibacter flagellatus TaxID=1387277 RepID=A0A917A7Z6_9RHOB|nr:alpha/beta fold hydrolase [Primorskyibacter flagellatus]GGE34434.1 alpha/beta hydrolase [Primorskyibacter flagellatus]